MLYCRKRVRKWRIHHTLLFFYYESLLLNFRQPINFGFMFSSVQTLISKHSIYTYSDAIIMLHITQTLKEAQLWKDCRSLCWEERQTKRVCHQKHITKENLPFTLCFPLGNFVMWEAFFSSYLDSTKNTQQHSTFILKFLG